MADNTAPHGAEGTSTEVQAQETDWKAEARKWESRAKENLTAAKANEAAAKRLTELENSQKTELQKALDEVAALKSQLGAFQQKEQVAKWAAEIVKDSDIPASVLRGSTREELEQHFDQLKSLAPKPKRTSAPAGQVTGDQGSRAVAALRSLGLGSE